VDHAQKLITKCRELESVQQRALLVDGRLNLYHHFLPRKNIQSLLKEQGLSERTEVSAGLVAAYLSREAVVLVVDVVGVVDVEVL